VKTIPHRRFADDEPVAHGLQSPEPRAVAGSCEASVATAAAADGAAEDWPRSGLGGPGPFQDVPSWIWKIFLSAWGLLFVLFGLFFTVNAAASFVITIAGLFAVMAFGLPCVMAASGRCEGHRCGPIVDTFTGPLNATAAGVQIALIPVAAVFGLCAFIALAM
jgi:hypothetical protein